MVLMLLIGMCLYFIPSIIGFSRGSAYAWVIFALNLVGGWTGFFWIAALVWSLWPKGHSAASLDVNLNHRGSIDLSSMAQPQAKRSTLEELEALAHLRTIGAITLEEFEFEKGRLLRG